MTKRLDASLLLIFIFSFSFSFLWAVAGCGGGTTAAIGDPCTKNEVCGSSRYCEMQSPGGECSAVCEVGDDLSDCGAGNVCGKNATGNLECKRGCTADAPCRAGYACSGTQGTSRYCVQTSGRDGG